MDKKIDSLVLKDLKLNQADQVATRLLTEIQSRRFKSIVISAAPGTAVVGMVNPEDFNSSDEVSRILKRQVTVVEITLKDFLSALDRSYDKADEIKVLAGELRVEVRKSTEGIQSMSEALGLGTASPEDAPVVRLLATFFEEAVRLKASDIHIEPLENVLRVRFRIDGDMHVQANADISIAPAVALRLKLAAHLNISEKRLPQDGRMKISLPQGPVDVRLSTMPTQYGESVVMRLLNQNDTTLSLDGLGIPKHMRYALSRAMKRPSGMILVTGPTGSGKTTTLYGAIGEVNTTKKKVITAEDPIEYRLPSLNQVQINEKIGLTFEVVLRAALRQDPDVVLVGEIRDEKTAEIAMRAAMTGHLVLSTVHSNDAVSTPARLFDLGVPNYMAALSLQLIIAQRLVRKLCNECAVRHEPNALQTQWMHKILKERSDSVSDEFIDPVLAINNSLPSNELLKIRRPVGCPVCHQTGYLGRKPVFEFIEMNKILAEALSNPNLNQDSGDFSRLARAHIHGHTMARGALDLVFTGESSIEEAMSIDNSLDSSDDIN